MNHRSSLFAMGLCVGLASVMGVAGTLPPYLDPERSVAERLADLLPRMTLEEKCAQVDLWPNLAELLKHESTEQDIALSLSAISKGVGAIEYDTKLPAEAFARFHRAVQQFLTEETRLGIPAIFDGEACHGFVGTNATVFPVPLILGSTWNPDLVECAFSAIALEMRSYGVTHAATPVLDLARDPRFGRFDQISHSPNPRPETPDHHRWPPSPAPTPAQDLPARSRSFTAS